MEPTYGLDELAARVRAADPDHPLVPVGGIAAKPTKNGREAVYRDDHLERLPLIAELRDRGLTSRPPSATCWRRTVRRARLPSGSASTPRSPRRGQTTGRGSSTATSSPRSRRSAAPACSPSCRTPTTCSRPTAARMLVPSPRSSTSRCNCTTPESRRAHRGKMRDLLRAPSRESGRRRGEAVGRTHRRRLRGQRDTPAELATAIGALRAPSRARRRA